MTAADDEVSGAGAATEGETANPPLISIGLPVYNGEKYLEICLRNLVEQTFPDFEIIVSDNASGDGTDAICRRFAESDPRIRYYRAEANQGASWNYNRVLELARGRYFKWAAYDDLLSPDFLEACLLSLEKDPDLVLSYGVTTIIDAEGRPQTTEPDRMHITDPRPSARLREYLYKVGLTNAIYGLMRIEALRATPGHQPYPGSDIVLLGELAIRGRFHEIDGIRFLRRIHPQASASANPSLSQLVGWFNPGRAGKLVLPEYERLGGYLSAIRRVPISLSEKARCLAVLVGWKRYGIVDLLKEVGLLVRYLAFRFFRLFRSSPPVRRA